MGSKRKFGWSTGIRGDKRFVGTNPTGELITSGLLSLGKWRLSFER